MIDENLPIFYFRRPREKGDFNTSIFLSQQGAEAESAYTLRRPDPSSQQAKNCYATALCDAYAPNVIYGEVLLEPEWSLPSLSMDAVRANGGVAPSPQPVLPNTFVIQLYDPDQQIHIKHIPSSWNSAASWEFAMPQQSFRRPSASTLDRADSDPTAKDTTPMIHMRWKRTGKLSKDIMCYLTGRSTNPDGSKRRQKEPDIPLSFFHHFSELTVYEPNVGRLDIEDPKGFEVAILLAASTIRDVYFNSLRDAFNIDEATIRPQTLSQRPPSGPPATNQNPQRTPPGQVPVGSASNQASAGRAAAGSVGGSDARKQWEVERETARLRLQLEEEEKALKRQEFEDAQRAKRLAAEEEQAERRRRREVEKETERLRQEWNVERAKIRGDDRLNPAPRPGAPDKGKKRDERHHRHHSHQPYLVPEPDINSPAGVFGPEVPRPKSSLAGGLNIFRSNDGKERKMLKKKSAVW